MKTNERTIAYPLYSVKKYTDSELIVGIIHMQSDALNYLYDQYAGALLLSISGILKDKKKVNAILQVVFKRIWSEIHSYDPVKGKLFTWMLSITKKETLRVVHSKIHRYDKVAVACDELIYEGEINPYLRWDVEIRQVVTQLKPNLKVALELYFYHGYTYQEIAGLMNISLITVKTNIATACEELKILMRRDSQRA